MAVAAVVPRRPLFLKLACYGVRGLLRHVHCERAMERGSTRAISPSDSDVSGLATNSVAPAWEAESDRLLSNPRASQEYFRGPGDKVLCLSEQQKFVAVGAHGGDTTATHSVHVLDARVVTVD